MFPNAISPLKRQQFLNTPKEILNKKLLILSWIFKYATIQTVILPNHPAGGTPDYPLSVYSDRGRFSAGAHCLLQGYRIPLQSNQENSAERRINAVYSVLRFPENKIGAAGSIPVEVIQSADFHSADFLLLGSSQPARSGEYCGGKSFAGSLLVLGAVQLGV